MKILYALVLIILFQQLAFTQSAQTYFPSQPGFKWTYRVTPLDSLNNPVNSLTYYQIDSFAVTQNYFGRTASYVVSKFGPELTVPFQPYLDTSYISFQSNDAYQYYRLFNFDSLLGGIGNGKLSPANVESFEGWFPYYKFAQITNLPYQVFSKDTSITFDTLTFPIRYELRGKRLSDQTITTDLGTFSCKRFLLSTVVSYLPLPILPIPLYTLLDTTYITQNNWIVKQVMPSSVVDLSAINLPTFTIPGSMKEAVPPIVVKVDEEEFSPEEFYLSQNYPNPFNPITRIQYQVSSGGNVLLKVYDILGNEVATLVNEYKPSGSYEVEFGARNQSSGVFFYQIKTKDFVSVKKMIFMK